MNKAFATLGVILLLAGAGCAPQTSAPTNQAPAPATIPVTVDPITHASMILTWGDVTIYNDPVGEASAFAGKPEADIILVSDIHADHLSAPTLEAVMATDTVLIAPKAVIDLLPKDLADRAKLLSNGDTTGQNGIAITAIPMYNLPETADSKHVKGRGNGYLLEKDGFRVYIAGDTSGTSEMRTLKDIDMAFVPMNGPTMSVAEAADAVLAFAPRRVYPYHYRSQDGLSDVSEFKRLVNNGSDSIEVIQLDWYPAAGPTPAASLQGKSWKWVSTSLADGGSITPKKSDAFSVTFGADGRLNGTTDCNSWFGTYEAKDGMLSFPTPFGATKMFCEGAQESEFLGQLDQAEQYDIAADGRLTLQLKSAGGSMIFKP